MVHYKEQQGGGPEANWMRLKDRKEAVQLEPCSRRGDRD